MRVIPPISPPQLQYFFWGGERCCFGVFRGIVGYKVRVMQGED
jgi:hypothetical protein